MYITISAILEKDWMFIGKTFLITLQLTSSLIPGNGFLNVCSTAAANCLSSAIALVNESFEKEEYVRSQFLDLNEAFNYVILTNLVKK